MWDLPVDNGTLGRIDGVHHYLSTQESITVVGRVWLRFIDSGVSTE